MRKRGKFATCNVWVTPHADDQRYPAGEHVVQSKVSALPASHMTSHRTSQCPEYLCVPGPECALAPRLPLCEQECMGLAKWTQEVRRVT